MEHVLPTNHKNSTLGHLLVQRRFRKLIAALSCLAIFLAAIIVPIESTNPQAQIKNWQDAIWWVVTTITTVGYGDLVPVTMLGRLVGILLQIIGVILFGSIIGNFTISMRHQREQHQWDRLFDHLNQIDSEIDQVKKKLDYLILSLPKEESFHSEKPRAEYPSPPPRQTDISDSTMPFATEQKSSELRQDLAEIIENLRQLQAL